MNGQTDRFICFELQNCLAQKPLLSPLIAHCVGIRTGVKNECFRFLPVFWMEAHILETRYDTHCVSTKFFTCYFAGCPFYGVPEHDRCPRVRQICLLGDTNMIRTDMKHLSFRLKFFFRHSVFLDSSLK